MGASPNGAGDEGDTRDDKGVSDRGVGVQGCSYIG